MGSGEVVRCRNGLGVLGELEIEELAGFVTPGSALDQQLVRVKGQVYVRKYVSRASGGRNPHLYDLLENEVRAGTRLGQVFRDAYPRQLASLVAYNTDLEEPFVLLREYFGEPAAGPATRFETADRLRFQHELLRALQLVSIAGLVHGAVGMETVRWHEGRLQLVDFEWAQRVGEPRRPGRRSIARSPEQQHGGGLVDGRDDVWGAGVLIRELHLGRLGVNGHRGQDPTLLRDLLNPVFDRPVEHRPTAADLLVRLHGDATPPPFADPDAPLAAGRELFEQVARRKTGAAPPPPAGKPRSWLRTLFTLMALAVVALRGTRPW
ncbi:hypothetical protein [Actinosynnema sp. NPDC020468]|uniref:hypothetical protein n=1 Tax=Actinosynnema sp. NPDC020468 TaxID=3154488 RepID=UPI00340776AC